MSSDSSAHRTATRDEARDLLVEAVYGDPEKIAAPRRAARERELIAG